MTLRITSRTRRVMTALNAGSTRSIRQICSDSGLRRGTVLPMLDRLIRAGWAEVAEVSKFRLTDQGRKEL